MILSAGIPTSSVAAHRAQKARGTVMPVRIYNFLAIRLGVSGLLLTSLTTTAAVSFLLPFFCLVSMLASLTRGYGCLEIPGHLEYTELPNSKGFEPASFIVFSPPFYFMTHPSIAYFIFDLPDAQCSCFT